MEMSRMAIGTDEKTKKISPLAMRECGNALVWQPGYVGVRQCGGVATWLCGSAGMRRCGNHQAKNEKDASSRRRSRLEMSRMAIGTEQKTKKMLPAGGEADWK